jgi:fumarate hydratase subunit beta
MAYKAVYMAAVGGAAALLARHITHSHTIAYPDLGPEAIYQLTVVNFPVIVINDCHGGDSL